MEKGFVKAMECVKMELGAPDASGRRKPVENCRIRFFIDADVVYTCFGIAS
jgi:glutamate synthase (NADPH/NADH) small chain